MPRLRAISSKATSPDAPSLRERGGEGAATLSSVAQNVLRPQRLAALTVASNAQRCRGRLWGGRARGLLRLAMNGLG